MLVAAVAFSIVALVPMPLGGCAHGPDPTKRGVDVHVSPWADIEVDGALVAHGQKAVHVELTIGPHVVRFVNPKARERELVVVVPADGPVPDVFVTLEPKPTLVVVRGRHARVDLDVRVDRVDALRSNVAASELRRHHVELRPGDAAAFEVRLDPPSP